MKKNIVITTLLLLTFSWNSTAQILEAVVNNFHSLKNVTYTSTVQEKGLFSDNLFYDTIRALISIEQNGMKSFKIKGIKQEDIFDGNKLIQLNFRDSTYRISKSTDNSWYFYKSLSYIINRLEENVKKNNSVLKLRDSMINGTSYYHLFITELDSIKNGKRIFGLVSLLVNKKTNLPYYYRIDSQGFLDGTKTFVTTFSEYYFTKYKINNKAFPDFSLAQVPSDFTLEKQKKSLPLLETGVKAPEVELTYASGKVFKIEKEKGKIILLNFTENGCPHCVESIETLNKLYERYKASDFLIVSINPFDNKESVVNFNSRFKVKYPLFITSSKSNNNIEKYHVEGYPTFYLIDKNGNIVRGFEGYYPTLEAELVSSIDRLTSS